MGFDQRVVAAGPWSLSKANVLATCASQYDFKYIQKVKEGAKSTQSRVGTTAHTIQEHALNHAPTFEDLQRFAREQIDKDGLTHNEAVEVTAKLAGVVDFARRVGELKAQYGVRKELVEHKLAMTADWRPTDFFARDAFLRGVIDYGLVTEAGVLLLVDHKAGRRKRIGEHAPQFYVYMDLAIVNFSVGEVDGIQSGINYFGSPDLDWFPRFSGEPGAWTRAEIVRHAGPWLEDFLNRLTKRLTVISDRTHGPSTGWQCEYCGYADPAHCSEGATHAAERRAKRAGDKNI